MFLNVPNHFQAIKSCEKVELELKTVQSLLESIGIADVEHEETIDNILEQIQNNVCILHRKSEDLTSKNLTLKIDIDKIRNRKAVSEVLMF